jgi:hypothetical protein
VILSIFEQKWVFHFIIVIFVDFIQHVWIFWPILGGDWALFEAISWGEVRRWLPTSDLYKPSLLEAMGGDSEQVYAEDLPSQSHFYAGKLLRSAPLRAISGSSGHPISVSFLLLGSIDLFEQDQISLLPFWHCYDVILKL